MFKNKNPREKNADRNKGSKIDERNDVAEPSAMRHETSGISYQPVREETNKQKETEKAKEGLKEERRRWRRWRRRQKKGGAPLKGPSTAPIESDIENGQLIDWRRWYSVPGYIQHQRQSIAPFKWFFF